MAHPLVDQLRFARSEWLRAYAGVSDEDGAKRLGPINAMGWTMGHLAWHENLCWNVRGSGLNPAPQLHDLVGYGKPASTPLLSEMRAAWHAVVAAADPYLEGLAAAALLTHWERNGKRHPESIGTALRRVTYHYLYHTGEMMAVRQLLGHTNLPEYIGDFDAASMYRA